VFLLLATLAVAFVYTLAAAPPSEHWAFRAVPLSPVLSPEAIDDFIDEKLADQELGSTAGAVTCALRPRWTTRGLVHSTPYAVRPWGWQDSETHAPTVAKGLLGVSVEAAGGNE